MNSQRDVGQLCILIDHAAPDTHAPYRRWATKLLGERRLVIGNSVWQDLERARFLDSNGDFRIGGQGQNGLAPLALRAPLAPVAASRLG